jgi:hypothetical protein
MHYAIAICAGLFLLAADMTPTLAAVSEATRRACEKKAYEARPALRADEKEAFVANCIADATVVKRRKRY